MATRATSQITAAKAAFAGKAVQSKATVKAAAISTKVMAARTSWMPGSVHPKHLDGTLPGDFGFDPLGLGADPQRLKYYQEAELMNARWAMMAVAGITATEVLGIGGPWYEAGAAEYDLPINALLAVQFPVMGILELRRIRGWLATGKSGVNETFPWDPMGMNGDAMALKEIKNGRLAMLAMLGMYVQALVTGKGPVSNWLEHLADPSSANGFAFATKFAPTLLASRSALRSKRAILPTPGGIPSTSPHDAEGPGSRALEADRKSVV